MSILSTENQAALAALPADQRAAIAAFLAAPQQVQPATPVMAQPSIQPTAELVTYQQIPGIGLQPETGKALVGELASKLWEGSYRPFDRKATLSEMRSDVRRVAARPDGTPGRHYVTLFTLTDPEGQWLLNWLRQQPIDPAKGKKSTTSYNGPRRAAASSSNVDARLDRMEALLMQSIQGQFQQPATPVAAAPVAVPATPVPVAGHTMQPATPVATVDVGNGEQLVVLRPNQPVICTLPDGSQEVRYVAPDGIRTNKMPSD